MITVDCPPPKFRGYFPITSGCISLQFWEMVMEPEEKGAPGTWFLPPWIWRCWALGVRVALGWGISQVPLRAGQEWGFHLPVPELRSGRIGICWSTECFKAFRISETWVNNPWLWHALIVSLMLNIKQISSWVPAPFSGRTEPLWLREVEEYVEKANSVNMSELA